ncbi:hypothetical protein ACWFNS_09010 [Oerskovia enterophila]
MSAFDADAFWVKARLFVNRAMEPGDERSQDERRLWAALALELLAKWALAETSPTLVADPVNAGGDQLLKALGLKEGGLSVTVSASTAFKRCQSIYRPFSEQDASKFSKARNDYLHGAEFALVGPPDNAWWSRYWSLIHVLLTAHERPIDDFVGSARVAEVEEHLARNAMRTKHQFEAAVEAARRNLARFEAGQMTAIETQRWALLSDRRAWLSYSDQATCPACGALGTVESDDALDRNVSYEYDDGYATVDVTFVPDHFSCPKCHLLLDDHELITEAGLDEEHVVPSDEDPYDEGEYGND